MKTSLASFALVTLASVLVDACASEPLAGSPDDIAAAEAALAGDAPEGPQERTIPSEARVPDTLHGQADCASLWEPPSACEWRDSVDALVIGTVRSLRLVTSNAFARTQQGWQPAKACEAVSPALTFRVEVEKSFAGNPGRSLQVVVGGRQVQRFRPLPALGDRGELRWLLQQGSEHGPLREGTRVVLALHLVDGRWSLMGDTMLGVDRDGIVHVPSRRGDCMNTTPGALDGMSIDELEQVLASCGGTRSARADRRRAAQRRAFGRRAIDHFAPICADAPAGDTADDTPVDEVIESITEHTGGAEPPPRPRR